MFDMLSTEAVDALLELQSRTARLPTDLLNEAVIQYAKLRRQAVYINTYQVDKMEALPIPEFPQLEVTVRHKRNIYVRRGPYESS